MRLKLTTLLVGVVLLMTTGCRELLDIFDDVQPRKIEVKDFASGLSSPLGLAVDTKGNVWVTEIGTGKDDGKVSMITENGTKYTVIEGFPSEINQEEGVPVGLNHLLVKDEILYILHAFGKMYKFDLSSFQPGNKPVEAEDLQTEDIGPFVLDYEFEQDTEESNPYNLIIGPEKDIFIVDAEANAISAGAKPAS